MSKQKQSNSPKGEKEADTFLTWAPDYENYTFLPTMEGTTMVVDQDVSVEWDEYITQSWPKALEILKELCESSAAA